MIKMAYLISCYPAVSHTFIQREVQALRSKGFSLFIASINETDIVEEQQTPLDKIEMQQTYYIKKEGMFRALGALTKTMLCRPLAVIKSICFSIRCGGTDIKRIVQHLFYFAEAVLVGSWMHKHKMTHIHVHFANPASTVAMIATQLYPFTFSMTVHGPDEFYDVTLNALTQKIALSKFIFCISYYTRSQLMRLSSSEIWNKFEITPLGIDPNIYQPLTVHKTSSRIEILCVGRLSPNKGHVILIKAVHLLAQQKPEIHLTIIGEGTERIYLQQLINIYQLQHYVDLPGAKNQVQILETYSKADIFVSASFAEGLPVVLMEAMSMGIPCVATAINAVPDLIKNKINGLLITPSNTVELSQSLAFLIDNPDLRKKLGQAARETILKRYNFNTNIEHLSNLFKHKLK